MVLIGFVAAALCCLVLSTYVDVNYKLSDYLPADAPSTIALRAMEESFDETLPNLSVYVRDITIPDALALKARIARSPGVLDVLWLDDVVDIYRPLEMSDAATVEAWYKDGGALFSVAMSEENIVENIDTLRELVGEDGVLVGDAANRALTQVSATAEVTRIVMFVVPLVLFILLLTSGSWYEPVLFMASIGVAILINEGTNLLLGEVSFVTRSVAAVMQMAVSMDYAVFLLHRFNRFRREGMPTQEAMSEAMVQAASSIAASCVTTVIGFAALVLMRFRIGPDMGIVLAKGVALSFVSVMVFLPALTMATARLIDRTQHRSLLPSFEGFGRFVLRVCVPLAVVALIAITPAYLGQKNCQFIYGSSGINAPDSQAQKDADRIREVFGQSVQLALLVPDNDIVREAQLSDALEDIDAVTSVVSYANMVGIQTPTEFLAAHQLSTFRSGGYSRLLLYVDTSEEGDDAFAAVDAIKDTAEQYYPGAYHLLGLSAVNYDLRETIVKDSRVVTIAVIGAIAVTLLVTFRSLSIPLVLLLTIQGATWINLSVPYFTGVTLNYVGYQIVSSVQLGATVDYGILFVKHYLDNRRTLDKKAAVQRSIAQTSASILTPASILVTAGLMLGVISSNGIISQLGAILGRGAALSTAMVLLVLPGLLLMFDGVIGKTTLNGSSKEGQTL